MFKLYLGLILGGVISGAAIIVFVLSLVIATIATITCCFIKKKSRKLIYITTYLLICFDMNFITDFKPSSEYNDYCTQSTPVELTLVIAM